jgi:hypothetical protein
MTSLSADAWGRDPYPNKQRLKHVVAPRPAEDADPATMLRPDGRRSDLDKTGAVGIYLGIDGEGRPLKSMENWVPEDPRVTARFYREYAPAVVREIKRRCPGKTIRAHTDERLKDVYLENDVDLHRESLESDEIHLTVSDC